MLQAQIFNLETERQQRARKTAKSQQKPFLDNAFFVFTMHAMKREINDPDYRDGGCKWSRLSWYTRNWIESFNQLPKETRPAVLEAAREFMRLDHAVAWKFVNQLDPGHD